MSDVISDTSSLLGDIQYLSDDALFNDILSDIDLSDGEENIFLDSTSKSGIGQSDIASQIEYRDFSKESDSYGKYKTKKRVVDGFQTKAGLRQTTRPKTSGENANYLSMSKNAILARENRQKKKKYINGLAKTVCRLTDENKILKRQCKTMRCTVSSLSEEVDYLRGVIYNQSTLSTLLKNIPSVVHGQHGSPTQLNVSKVNSVSDSTIHDSDLSAINSFKEASVQLPYIQNAVSTSDTLRYTATIDHDYSERSVVNRKLNRRSYDINSSSQTRAGDQPPNNSPGTSGVCLHVSDKTVTVELCATCNRKAHTLTYND